MRSSIFLMMVLILGIVDQVSNGVALIEYEQQGEIKYTHISIADSGCTLVEGQKVLLDGDKIVNCKP